MGAELLYADERKGGRTDLKTVIVASRNFANAPKNSRCCLAEIVGVYSKNRTKDMKIT